ncbi:hypothetical protein G6011_09723 [Alternaria panax]|uniref:Uncharacterized protein n=1 Tax=Alternaria panax TaxID=48097 RepID=A0AAD4I2K1_9PLEO|nr:hypothetical protein G6011_09723 [Alternaria panax]
MTSAKRAKNKSSVKMNKGLKKPYDKQHLTAQPSQDDTTFPFLDLPGEIRNMIYD